MRTPRKFSIGRPLKCNGCNHVFRGKGMTRVLRKIVFHFCPACWLNRLRCEEFMAKVAA